MNLNFTFINKPTEDFFNCTRRNQCLCGGYGSGKTYAACMKIILLALAFKKYRIIIARKEYQALMKTTYATFMKLMPEKLISTYDQATKVMTLVNGTQIIWMNLDKANEQTLRGIEANTIYLDQPEELDEQIYTTLDSRLDRWDKAEPTEETLAMYGYSSIDEWPREPMTGRLVIPAYMMLTPNPDNETHWIWRLYHPHSPEAARNLEETHAYFQVSSKDNPKLSRATLDQMMKRDPSWVSRFVEGNWGISEASIHTLLPHSVIDPPKEWIENWLKKSALYRVLDHGETAPTCCTWFAVHKNIHVAYREYYQPGKLVSDHRRNIHDLSLGENFVQNLADPAIFKETSQKYNGRWTTAKEYYDPNIDAPPLIFTPADNNELATRNRINEWLSLHSDVQHPVTGEKPAPRLYFVKKNPKVHNYGVEHSILQIRSQKRVKLAEINGRPIFSDEREDSIEDHAYDTIRYYVARHAQNSPVIDRSPAPGSFFAARLRAKAMKQKGKSEFTI